MASVSPGAVPDSRPIAVVTATSIVTLPTVRNRSGTVSTATRMPSASSGTPITAATGDTDAKKLIVPGNDTDPMVVIAAVTTPAASWPGPIGVPVRCATYRATARFIAGLVARNTATAIN